MNIKEKIIKTLHQAAPGLEQLQDDYFIYGSAASILSEVNIPDTQDIDILVSHHDAELLKHVWHSKDLDMEPKPSDKFRSNLSRYRFELIDIEITGNLEICHNGEWHPFVIYDYITYPIGKLLIKIPTLEEQRNILNTFGRKKDIEKIKLINERINNILHK